MEQSIAKYGLSELDALCLDAVTRAEESAATAIVLITRGQQTARWTAKYHGKSPIFVLTDQTNSIPQVEGLVRGCRGIHVEKAVEVNDVVEIIRAAGHPLEKGVVIVVDDWEKKAVMTEISI